MTNMYVYGLYAMNTNIMAIVQHISEYTHKPRMLNIYSGNSHSKYMNIAHMANKLQV